MRLGWRLRGARSFMGTFLPKMARGRLKDPPEYILTDS